MKHISFQNDGLIDLRAVRTFGVSSKETNNPIGQFGTGLKYAISVSLRTGCKFTLWLGLEKYTFDIQPTRIRVDDFNVITMTGPDGIVQELAFTTHLGQTWEPWQALRELWCNALDEGGDICGGELDPVEGKTTIIVTGQAMMDAYHARDSIMLFGTPKWFSEGVEVLYKRSTHSYFRNVRVGDLQRPAVLTYNVVGYGMHLTEDRTLKYPYTFETHCRDALASTEDEDLIRELIDAPAESFEGGLDFSDATPGPALMNVLAKEDFNAIANQSLLRMYRKKKGISIKPTDVKVDENEEKQLKKALKFLETIGYIVTDYPIHITDDLQPNVLGIAYEGAIYINRRTFMQGTKMVAGTILEEWIHLHHKLHDETRALQNYLVDAVMTMGEKLVGEPI